MFPLINLKQSWGSWGGLGACSMSKTFKVKPHARLWAVIQRSTENWLSALVGDNILRCWSTCFFPCLLHGCCSDRMPICQHTVHTQQRMVDRYKRDYFVLSLMSLSISSCVLSKLCSVPSVINKKKYICSLYFPDYFASYQFVLTSCCVSYGAYTRQTGQCKGCWKHVTEVVWHPWLCLQMSYCTTCCLLAVRRGCSFENYHWWQLFIPCFRQDSEGTWAFYALPNLERKGTKKRKKKKHCWQKAK